MFICPTCQEEFEQEQQVVKHYLSCWKQKHPAHKANAAPRSDDINTRVVSNDIMEFFEGLK